MENPLGPHPYIKTALSPLDFAGRWLRLNYLGDLSVAEEPEKVDITKLRGFKNGAFRTYNRQKVDGWDVDQVLRDPEYGGFVEYDATNNSAPANNETNNSEFKNIRGVICGDCGNIMKQTSANCFSCGNCGGKIGGCGI